MEWTDEQREAIRAVATKFEGTPHRDRIAIPGIGVDCIMLAIEIYRAAGIFPEFTIPQYKTNHGIFRDHNILSVLFRDFAHFRQVGVPEIDFGDTLVFRVGRYSNHVGVVVDGKCVHSIARTGVVCSTMTPGFLKKVEAVMRPERPGLKADPQTINTFTLYREAFQT